MAPASSRAAFPCVTRGRSVGLVDGADVGDLEDAELDALQLFPGAGEGEEEERVDHLGDGDLRLPHTHGLHQPKDHLLDLRRRDCRSTAHQACPTGTRATQRLVA
jgi:hypothetical protein